MDLQVAKQKTKHSLHASDVKTPVISPGGVSPVFAYHVEIKHISKNASS